MGDNAIAFKGKCMDNICTPLETRHCPVFMSIQFSKI